MVGSAYGTTGGGGSSFGSSTPNTAAILGWVNVKDMHARGDGVTDDTAAIQAAIDSLPVAGGVVYFPGGVYIISSTLNVGNGSSSAPSTKRGVRLVGAGSGGTAAQIAESGPAMIRWDGAAGGTMISVKGPIHGVEISGLNLDAKKSAAAAATCLLVTHAMNSRFGALVCSNWSGVGIDVTAYANPTGAVDGCNNNSWDQVVCLDGDGTTYTGIRIGASTNGASPFLAVSRNTFWGCEFKGGSAGVGIELRFCDNLSFVQCWTGSGTGTGVKISPPTGDTSFPKEVSFYSCPVIGNVSGTGWTGTDGILFMPYPQGDGEATPTQNFARGLTTNGIWFGTSFGFFGVAAVTRPLGGVTITNNVTVGGTTNQVDNVVAATTDVTAASLTSTRNAIYQLSRKQKLVVDALRTLGLLQNADV